MRGHIALEIASGRAAGCPPQARERGSNSFIPA